MSRGKIYMVATTGALLAGMAATIALFPSARLTDYRRDLRTVRDLAGREVAVPREVNRLVALGPGALRLVVYLGAADRIVGIEDFERRMARDLYVRPYASALDDALLSLPIVGTGGPGALPDPERLLLCRPELIVAVGLDPSQLDNIQAKTGVPVVCLSYGQLGVWRGEAQQSLSLLGEFLGTSERAAALNEYVESLEQDLRKRTADIDEKDKPSAYFGGISHKGAQGLASTEAGYPPARMAGVRNLADGLGKAGHFIVDREQIILWDPDFIFVDAASRLILDQDFEHNRQFYRLLSSSASGNVLSLLPYNYYNTNIELALLNAYFVGKSAYPDRFSDIDVEDKASEIIRMFVGIAPDQELPACRPVHFPPDSPVQWR